MSDFQRRIKNQSDVEAANRAAGGYARAAGMEDARVAEFALICSELANNLLDYGTDGVLTLTQVGEADRWGLRVEARDAGPGITNVGLAMTRGHSTGGGLGEGLPLVERLADEFDLKSTSEGTSVTVVKWK